MMLLHSMLFCMLEQQLTSKQTETLCASTQVRMLAVKNGAAAIWQAGQVVTYREDKLNGLRD